jgi:hypothetical protein
MPGFFSNLAATVAATRERARRKRAAQSAERSHLYNEPMEAAQAEEYGREQELYEQGQESRNQYLDFLGGGQGALDEYVRGAVSRALPGFDRRLQGMRESSIRRGVGGALSTSYEGDLASAFQQNIADATAGQAMNLYGTQARGYSDVSRTDLARGESSRNRYLDILTGNRDFWMGEKERKRKKKGGLFGALGGIIGGVGGFLAGGPAGAVAGSKIGSTAGGAIGG